MSVTMIYLIGVNVGVWSIIFASYMGRKHNENK